MKYYLLFFLLLYSSLQAKAQLSDSLNKALPDSLRPKNKLVVTDKEKMGIILNTSRPFAQQYYAEMEAITGQLEQAIETINPREEQIPYALAIASFYAQVGVSTKSVGWFQRVITLGRERTRYRSDISNAYINVAIIYSIKNKQDSAVSMLYQAMDIASVDKDSATLRDIYYSYIPIYTNLLLYHQALEYANKFLNAVPLQAKWQDAYTEVFIAKARLYARLYQAEKKPVYADSASRLIDEVMVVKKKQAAYWYHPFYNTLGSLAYYRQDYPLAFRYFDLALSPQYTQPGAYQSALRYRVEVYRNACLVLMGRSEGVPKLLSIAIPPKDFDVQKTVHLALYEYYNKKGNPQQALDHYRTYQAYLDSTDVIGQRGRIFEAEQKYSVAQKEAAIAVLETRNLQAEAVRNKIIVTAIVVVLLLAILALLLYLRTKRQQAQRLTELHSMEQEMELDRLRQQAENDAAIVGQRKAISQNMHDEVSSDLAAVRYFITDLKGRVKTDEARLVLSDVEEEVQTVYQQSRDFMIRLNQNNVPEAYNVFSLLDNLSLRFGKGSTLQIDTQVDARLARKLTARQHAELYRVTKEAVANCLKHSGASQLSIVLAEQGDSIILDIQDNGRGVKAEPGQGLGMTTMHERIESLGGSFHLSPSERGLHIHANFPKAG